MFQPGAQRRRNHGPGRRPAELEPRLVLALPPGALPGEQRAHHGAARPLDEREAVARARAEQEGQGAPRTAPIACDATCAGPGSLDSSSAPASTMKCAAPGWCDTTVASTVTPTSAGSQHPISTIVRS